MRRSIEEQDVLASSHRGDKGNRERKRREESAMIKTREETSLTFGTLASISTERRIEPQIRNKL